LKILHKKKTDINILTFTKTCLFLFQSQASSSASLNSYLPEWPNSATETSIWRNQFDFSALSTGSSSDVLVPAAITATTVDLPLATVVSSSGWQMLDGTCALPPDPNKREPLKNAFTNVLKAAAAVVPARQVFLINDMCLWCSLNMRFNAVDRTWF